ncbi:MAG TPA: hypothetical protein ENJ08_13005 [Gammaproteobacteria bacterium]|nr:hypothetical protein [Gammaproteobacteria bacterium]
MTGINTNTDQNIWYAGPERRVTHKPRRSLMVRRYRKRLESLVSDCRSGKVRRKEDEDGYVEF